MLSQTRKAFGFTLIELLIVIAVTMLIFTTILLITRPEEQKAKARDNRRLADITTLDRAILEYRIDNDVYPDLVNTLRTSTSLPVGNTGPYELITDGWLDADLSYYTSKLPIDPVNNGTYYYAYQHTTTNYELNARLEYYTGYMEEDGGNSASWYEIGTDLTIL